MGLWVYGSVDLWVCRSVGVYVHMSMWCAYMWTPEVNIGVFFNYSLPCYLRQSLTLGLVGNDPPRNLLGSAFPVLGVTMPGIFYLNAGDLNSGSHA